MHSVTTFLPNLIGCLSESSDGHKPVESDTK
jgi:hypothetical protein